MYLDLIKGQKSPNTKVIFFGGRRRKGEGEWGDCQRLRAGRSMKGFSEIARIGQECRPGAGRGGGGGYISLASSRARFILICRREWLLVYLYNRSCSNKHTLVPAVSGTALVQRNVFSENIFRDFFLIFREKFRETYAGPIIKHSTKEDRERARERERERERERDRERKKLFSHAVTSEPVSFVFISFEGSDRPCATFFYDSEHPFLNVFLMCS